MPDWKPETIKPLCQLPMQEGWAMAVAVCGDTRKVVGGDQHGLLVAWDLPSEVTAEKADDKPGDQPVFAALPPTRSFVGHTNTVTRLAATPDGATLVSASLDRTVRIWDLKAAATGETELVLDRKQRKRLAQRQPEAQRKEFLAAPGVKVPTQQAAAVLDGHKDWIQALGITRDGQRAITGDDSGVVIVWDVAARKEISRWRCPGVAWVSAVALSPDGQTALVSQFRRKGGDYNNYPAGLRLHNVADGAVKLDVLATLYPKEKNPPYQYQYEYHKFIAAGLVAAAFSPDGKLAAVGQGGEDGDGKVHLLEVDSGKALRTIGGHQYGVTDLTFTADGKHLLTVGRDTTLRVLDLEGKELAKLGKPRGGQFTDWLSAVSLSPDEKLLAASDISGFLQVWAVG